MLVFTCSTGPVSHTVSIMVPTPLSPSLYWSLLTHYGAYVAGLTGCTTRETPRALNGWQSNSQEYLQGRLLYLLTSWLQLRGATHSMDGRWEMLVRWGHQLNSWQVRIILAQVEWVPPVLTQMMGHSLTKRQVRKTCKMRASHSTIFPIFLLKEIFIGKCITNLGMFIYHYNAVSSNYHEFCNDI